MEKYIEPEEMPVSEVEERVRSAVNYLEGEINRVDETPGKRNRARRKLLAFTFITALAEKYRIVPRVM